MGPRRLLELRQTAAPSVAAIAAIAAAEPAAAAPLTATVRAARHHVGRSRQRGHRHRWAAGRRDRRGRQRVCLRRNPVRPHRENVGPARCRRRDVSRHGVGLGGRAPHQGDEQSVRRDQERRVGDRLGRRRLRRRRVLQLKIPGSEGNRRSLQQRRRVRCAQVGRNPPGVGARGSGRQGAGLRLALLPHGRLHGPPDQVCLLRRVRASPSVQLPRRWNWRRPVQR